MCFVCMCLLSPLTESSSAGLEARQVFPEEGVGRDPDSSMFLVWSSTETWVVGFGEVGWLV